MQKPSPLLIAVFAIATLADSACGSDYVTDFSSFTLGEMNGKQGWIVSDPTANAGAIIGIGGPWGSRCASLGYVAPILNDHVYLSHAATTPLVGRANASFSVLFQVVDSDSGYGGGSEARDTFGFRLENAAGANLFSFFLTPFDQDPTPENDTAFHKFSWSTGDATPTAALAPLAAREAFAYTFKIAFAPSGVNDVSFIADINGDSFSGMLTGMAGEMIGEFGAFWIPLNGARAPGSNFLIFDNVSLVTKPLAVTGEQYGDFTYTSDGAAVTIIGYTGAGGAVAIPATINSLPVTKLWNSLFSGQTGLTRITIPDGVTSIGSSAFAGCTGLTSVTLPGSAINLGNFAFSGCTNLASVTLTTGVASIGANAFENCIRLTNVTFPASVTYLGRSAFAGCASLTGAFFMGNIPGAGLDVFSPAGSVTVYYLPGTHGWGGSFSGRPAVLWNPVVQTGDGSFGVGTNGFGFNITGTANIPIVVEASTTLASGSWLPLRTLSLTNGWCYFSDPDSADYPARFYRVRSP
ncbi:MAG: leucine-rich repeat domain-containing protein [Verrucomicrobia bacterium]|nr:leucine-rich repeat domain-containing protein [Verrucomicrobiota bacterium]